MKWNGVLNFYISALEYTDISTHIKPDGHYTVFAPTDEAFNKLEEGQKQKILSGGGCVDSKFIPSVFLLR